MFWGEFWPQLIATLIGVGFGALFGVWGALLLDRRQENLKRLEDKQARFGRRKL